MKNLCCFVFFAIYLNLNLIQCSPSYYSNAPIISTKYGKIEGLSDSDSYRYLGIPYASPPINNLRWKKPINVKSWAPKILQATKYQLSCPQNYYCGLKTGCTKTYSEDCLYLNVFVPKTSIKKNSKKAVMIFIHGGSFEIGSSSVKLYNGNNLASIGDVIVVTFNYRLGALGYLFSGDGNIEANFGIFDQQLAIKWVYENINAFGGDIKRITIFGQSSGAQSVVLHLLNPKMQFYFNNAILESLPATMPLRNESEAITLYEYFLYHTNCTDSNCLKSKTVNEILAAQAKTQLEITSTKFLLALEPWVPLIDGNLIKGQILEIDKWLNNYKFSLKPFIIGMTTEECMPTIYEVYTDPIDDINYQGILYYAFGNDLMKNVLNKYPPEMNTTDQRPLLAKLTSEWIFTCSSRNFLETYLNNKLNYYNNNFYFYLFDFYLDKNEWNTKYCLKNVCHESELPFVFNNPYKNFSKRGHELSLQMIRYWSNYAKTTNPNIDNDEKNEFKVFKWPKYDIQNRYALKFNNKSSNSIINNYLKSICNFYDKSIY